MRKFSVLLSAVLLFCVFSFSACGQHGETGKDDWTSQTGNGYSDGTVNEDGPGDGENAVDTKAITITCGNNTLEITLADTVSADAFVKRLAQSDVTVSMREYGGFEMVGGLGFSLARKDEHMTANTGDVVLYGGNNIVIFYGGGGMRDMEAENIIEMLHITKEFPGIIANDDITLQLRKGEIHALLGENGAGKSTLMSVLFGLYQPEAGEIRKNGQVVKINNPNDATALGIGMVHQHFKLIDVFTVLDNIILGAETTRLGFLQKREARKKVEALSERYGLKVDLDAKVEDITVGMQQRVEILKMLYRDNEILIFDEPTAVLTPQEIDELMATMKEFAREGKSILFISHKLNEIMAVADRVTVLRKGKYIGTVETKDTDKQSLSNMMVGRPVQLEVVKGPAHPTDVVLHVENFSIPSKSHKRDAVHEVSFDVRAGEIVCIAGIDGNGQTEFVYGLTGLEKSSGGTVTLCGKDITHASIHQRGANMSHIPEDRHKHGLVLDFTLEQNMVLQRFREPQFQNMGFIRNGEVRIYAEGLIEKFDVRSGQGPVTIARSMSGGNQQKAIIARELDREKPLIVAVQPTRGLDVGAIEYIHSQLVAERDQGKAILLRILVMYEGEIVGELDPKQTTVQEMGLYMAGAKRMTKAGEQA